MPCSSTGSTPSISPTPSVLGAKPSNTSSPNAGYSSGRSFTDGVTPISGIETLPPADPYATRTVLAVGPTTTLSQLKSFVEEAEAEPGKGWVQYVFHSVCTWGCSPEAAAQPETIRIELLHEFMAWLAARGEQGTTVKTVREALGLGALQAPGAPTDVQAADAGATSVAVSWSVPTEGGPAASYEVIPYIGSQPQEPTIIPGYPPVTTGLVTGLTTGTAYTLRVRALNATGAGPLSEPSEEATPSGPVPPSAPIDLIARPASASALVEWEPPLSDGESPISGYEVTAYIEGEAQKTVSVGPSETSAIVPRLENSVGYTFKVQAFNSVGPGPRSQLSKRVKPQPTLFDFATPATLDTNDPNSVELGMKFQSDLAGDIRGVRFYKSAENSGVHIGSLWTAAGQLLAQATFTEETPTGWQTALNGPVNIAANTTYVVSYFAPHGHYSRTLQGFAGGAIVNHPLRGLGDNESTNGVFAYSGSSTFPTESFGGSNYYVDPLFDRPPPRSAPLRRRRA